MDIKTLADLYEEGFDITLSWVVRRGEVDGKRDFYYRAVYYASGNIAKKDGSIENVVFESPRMGFKSGKEAINHLIKWAQRYEH